MDVVIRIRRNTQAFWEFTNPVLDAGEPVLARDTGMFKIGDGVTAWRDLPGFIAEPEILSAINAAITQATASTTFTDVDAQTLIMTYENAKV
jgi:hypothetical protein